MYDSRQVPLECITASERLFAAFNLTRKASNFLMPERQHVSLEVPACICAEIAIRILARNFFRGAGSARYLQAARPFRRSLVCVAVAGVIVFVGGRGR